MIKKFDDLTVVEFGHGTVTVELGKYGDQYAVFINNADPPGTPGQLVLDTKNTHGFEPDEIVLVFPSKKRAAEVVNSLFNGGLVKTGQQPTVQVDPVAEVVSGYSGDPDTRGDKKLRALDLSGCKIGDKLYTKQAEQPEPGVTQSVAVSEIIKAVADFVGSQEGGPFTPAVIKAAIIGQLEYGNAFTKLLTPPVISHSQQNDALVKALESLMKGYASLLEGGIDRITHLDGDCDLIPDMLRDARKALTTYRKHGDE